jgi:iron complex outermembrane receptor protein
MKSTNNNYSGKVGLDYNVGKNTTIGTVVSGFSSPGTFENRNLNYIYNPSGALVSNTNALSTQEEKWKNINANLNFRQLLDTTGTELTADLDYIMYNGIQNQTLSNVYLDAQGNSYAKPDTLYGSLPQKIDIYSGKIGLYPPDEKRRPV